MKQIKKVSLCLWMMIICIGMMPAVCVKAAEDKIPDKVRIYFDESSDDVWASTSIMWEMDDVDERVAHIKTSSKDCYADINYFDAYVLDGTNRQRLGIYVRKEGTYQVTFDIVKNNKVVSKHKIKVYAYPMPVTVKLGTLKDGLLVGDKGKLDVKIKKGNTIKKIESGVCKPLDGYSNIFYRFSYQKVKNGSTITYGKNPQGDICYNNKVGSKYALSSNLTYIYAPTRINVTYRDQYTKQDETCSVEYLKIIGL